MSDLLVLTTTHEAFRHEESIAAGVPVLRDLARAAGLGFEHTEDAGVLSAGRLAGVRAVVFLHCNGEILTVEQRAALRSAVEAGCGFAGVHNASGAERDWPGYLDLIGARFASHPQLTDQPRALRVVDASHASTRVLPAEWSWSDEWYEFEQEPVGVEPLLVLADEPTRALAWHGRLGQGRTWYTALGHRGEAWSDALFTAHVWGGIESVLA